MRGFDAYKKQKSTPAWTRIDMLLAAYDGVLDRLRRSQTLLAAGQDDEALPLLIRAQRIIVELYAGLDLSYGEIPENTKRIYLYVLSRIGLGEELDLTSAIQVLQTIREALFSIRDEAAQLELAGKTHPIDHDIRTLGDALG